MNLVSQKYILEVYHLFPAIGIPEFFYLKKLKKNVDEYMADNNSYTLDELYMHFGSPEEIVLSYYSMADIGYIIKKIRIRRFLRNSILAFLIMILVASISFYIYRDKINKGFRREAFGLGFNYEYSTVPNL